MAKVSSTAKRDFFDQFRRRPAHGVYKHRQLREALLKAIDSGSWAAGDNLPTEAELVRLTPFSLGTVQRAIRSLVEDGLVVRRRGRGSFVTDKRSRMQNPLHFRFLSDDGAGYLPVFPKVLSRQLKTGAGPWTRHLNTAGRAVLRIDRLLSINDEFNLYSRFYVDPGRFRALARESLKALHSANFTKLIGRESNVPVSYLYQRVCTIRFPAAICRAIKVRRATSGILLEIIGHAADGQAVYFQEIFIPPTERQLVISDRTGVEKTTTMT
ncbi:MAG: GntR family transcriptional regulator [Rhodospirillales bacterium]|nr:GntR family transcriptional regulator [Rhodospirillales bacterium]